MLAQTGNRARTAYLALGQGRRAEPQCAAGFATAQTAAEYEHVAWMRTLLRWLLCRSSALVTSGVSLAGFNALFFRLGTDCALSRACVVLLVSCFSTQYLQYLAQRRRVHEPAAHELTRSECATPARASAALPPRSTRLSLIRVTQRRRARSSGCARKVSDSASSRRRLARCSC